MWGLPIAGISEPVPRDRPAYMCSAAGRARSSCVPTGVIYARIRRLLSVLRPSDKSPLGDDRLCLEGTRVRNQSDDITGTQLASEPERK